MTLPSLSSTSKRVMGVGSTVMTAGAALLYSTSYINPYMAMGTVALSLTVGGATLLCGTTYVIRGQIRLANAQDHAGVLVTLSGTSAATTTTDVNGTFLFTVLAGGNYVVTPTLAHYAFTPASRPFDNVRADQNAPFRSDLVNYAIHGQVTRNGALLRDVRMAISGDRVQQANTNGTYDIPLPALGNYTMTPSRNHYVFDPLSTQVASLMARTQCSFTASYVNYTISGTVTRAGHNLPGVSMTLTGGAAGVQTTNDDGHYTHQAAATGTYTITPTRAQHTFVPANRRVASLTQNQIFDFTATLLTYRIHGRITLDNGNGVDGLPVHLSGDRQANVTTAGGGYYAFANVPALGSYTVGGRRIRYNYAPRNATLEGIIADAQVDFVATLRSVTLRCELKLNGQPLGDVAVRIVGGGVDTNLPTGPDGARQEVVPSGENYVVTPASPHHIFTPLVHNRVSLTQDQTIEFTATQLSHTVSGRVTNVPGAGLDGINVRCSIFSQTREVQTAGGGLFTFANVPSGRNGRVWVNDGHFTSNPADVTIAAIAADRGNVNFALTRQQFTISGTLTIDGVAQVGTPVDLFLDGAQIAIVYSAAGGAFTFGARTSTGGSYRVKPRRNTTLTFAPFHEVVGDLLEDRADLAFDGTQIDVGNLLTTTAGVLFLSGEARLNIAGQRGADHAIPLDVLAEAARCALGRPSNDRRGGHYFPITGRGVFLAFILNIDRGSTLLSCYEKPRAQVERDVGLSGLAFETWANGRPRMRAFTGGEDLLPGP